VETTANTILFRGGDRAVLADCLKHG